MMSKIQECHQTKKKLFSKNDPGPLKRENNKLKGKRFLLDKVREIIFQMACQYHKLRLTNYSEVLIIYYEAYQLITE